MIEKSMGPGGSTGLQAMPEGGDIEVIIEMGDEDGLMEVLLGEKGGDPDFYANLAQDMDEDQLRLISNELLEHYRTDLTSRHDWEETYKDGLDLLGLKMENRTEPWDGACGVTHPLLAEAVVKFQSETIMETFPASGPVKTKIIGKITPEKTKAAERVRDDMNWWLTEAMPEYRAEHERLLWNLAVAGCAFKKTYFDPYTKRPISVFVPAEDFIAPYGATDLHNTPRYAHRMRKTPNEVRKMIAAGFYRDIELGDPVPERDDIREKKDDQVGASDVLDGRHTILEYHVELDLAGYEDESGVALPYVVHMDKSSGDVFAIYRNWEEGDEAKNKRMHFAKYSYIPGFGFYDFGLIHLVGGFAKGATSLVRQLVDAGTLSNLPGGLKTRGLRIKGDNTPITPGEFRDADVPSGTIKENIMTLPYKEPSQVLYQLLENIVAEGRRFAAVADVNISDMQANAPMGSTLAILERTLKTMSAIQARVHAAMKCEFKILKQIVRDNTPDDYAYDADAKDGEKAKQADYDIVEIVPVSDPNASSLAQRVAQFQTVVQMVQQAPQIYDLRALHRQMIESIGIQNADKLVPTEDDLKPTDPVSENMAMLKGDPAKAFIHQDHEAHIATHLAFMHDPKLQQLLANDPTAQAKHAAGMAHINEHLAFAYRQQIEKNLGFQLPAYEEELPPEIEVEMSRMMAQAAAKLAQANQAEMAQKKNEQMQQDPMIQLQMADIKIKEAEVQRKAMKDQMDHQVDVAKLEIEKAKVESHEKIQGAQIGSRVAMEKSKQEAADQREGFKAGINLVSKDKDSQNRQKETAARPAPQPKEK